MLRAAAISAALSASAAADIIYQTNSPYFGPNGPPGFDLMNLQSVALRFTPDRDYTLDSIRMWIMSNDLSPEPSLAPVRVEVRPSLEEGRRPGLTVIELMGFNVSAVGWNPVLESVFSRTHPFLRAGTPYWIILHCDLHVDTPAWNWSDGSVGIIALSHNGQVEFTVGGEGAVTGIIIDGSPACYANCDRSTAAPVLTANDFQCFLNAFAAQDDLANCDRSTTPPILTANDFQCFMNAFAQGCT